MTLDALPIGRKARIVAVDWTGLDHDEGRRLRVLSNDDTDKEQVDRLLHPPEQTVTFADVGGLDEIKTQIEKRIILPFQKPGGLASG